MSLHHNINIPLRVGECGFHAVNILSEIIYQNIPLHSHGKNCFEIHYISEGQGILNANGLEYNIIPNTLYVTGPLMPHSQITDPGNPMREWCLYLRLDEMETVKPNSITAKFLSQNFWLGRNCQNIFPLFERLFYELDNSLEGFESMAGHIISEIIITIARNYINVTGQTGRIIGSVSERTSIIIEEYFLYEYRTADLGELSARLGLSPRQTQRVIEKLYGSSFSEKKTQARMAAATVLLFNSPLSLAEISERLGYSSQEYFTTAFKAHYGISPGKYRKSKKL